MISKEFYDHLHALDHKYTSNNMNLRQTTEEIEEQIDTVNNADNLDDLQINVSWEHIPDNDPDLLYCQKVADTWAGEKPVRKNVAKTPKQVDESHIELVASAIKHGAISREALRSATGLTFKFTTELIKNNEYLRKLKERYKEIVKGYIVITVDGNKRNYHYFKDFKHCCEGLGMTQTTVHSLISGREVSKKVDAMSAANWYNTNLLGGIEDEEA